MGVILVRDVSRSVRRASFVEVESALAFDGSVVREVSEIVVEAVSVAALVRKLLRDDDVEDGCCLGVS